MELLIPRTHSNQGKKFPLNSTPPKCSVTYLCNHYDLYSKPFTENGEKDNDEMTSKTFRVVSLHNNERGNSHGLEGKKGARKSNSAKVLGAPFTASTCAVTPETFPLQF
eukprot:scaffold19351_cov108-Amphora_coffeaeformis.AAC.1